MSDLAEYKRAIQWLERGIVEQAREPENSTLRDAVSHSFEVTYNVTETVLRQALSQLSDDSNVPFLTSLELMRYAMDEGLALVPGETWLRYGLAIGRAHETLDNAFPESILPLLPHYLQALQSFSIRLEERLAPHV